VLSSRLRNLTHAEEKYLKDGREPCMTVVSVEVSDAPTKKTPMQGLRMSMTSYRITPLESTLFPDSEAAICECCLLHDEDANAGPSSVDDRPSNHTASEPSTLFPASEAPIRECCQLREENANAGPSFVDDRPSDHTAREPSTLFPDLDGHHGQRELCMPFHA
jgi:hypothetical protein